MSHCNIAGFVVFTCVASSLTWLQVLLDSALPTTAETRQRLQREHSSSKFVPGMPGSSCLEFMPGISGSTLRLKQSLASLARQQAQEEAEQAQRQAAREESKKAEGGQKAAAAAVQSDSDSSSID